MKIWLDPMGLKTQVWIGLNCPNGSKGSAESESNLCCCPVHLNMGLKCNTLICLQLAMHRVSSCGTHRVVTHSRKTRFPAHGTSCAASPVFYNSKEACSEEQGTIVSRRWSTHHNGYAFWPLHPEHGLHVATATSFRPSQKHMWFRTRFVLFPF